VVFYGLCALLAVFCAIALGVGNWLFAVLGMVLAIGGFRARRRRWWGLALGAAGLGMTAGALAGWRATGVTFMMVLIFAVLTALRVLGRAASRA
jgi:hypothetical protein